MINRKLLAFLVPAAFTLSAAAQSGVPDFQALKNKYKDDDVVYLKYNEVYEIEPGGDGLDIVNITDNEMLYLTENSTYYAKREVQYVEMVSEISEMEAYTMVPKGKGSYKKVKVSEYEENKNTSSDVFYDDVHVRSFYYPQLVKEAIGVLKYSEKIKDPHFLGKFYFASGIPVEDAVFRVKVHKDVDLKYVLKNPKDDIVFSEVTEGKYKIYTWTRKNIAKLKSESQAKPITYETPHIMLYIASYKGKSGTVKVLENTSGLYKYCYSLLDKGLEKPTPEIMKLTDSLTAGAATDEDKVTSIYSYIQQNIKYIAFEDGLGGFIPRKPSMVCERKYGDCKDIANLLYTMLNYAGVPTYHAWVGTMDIPYKFSELPIMGVANHMVAASYFNKRWYFLDGTANFLSHRYPSDFIQGKQAMLGISPDSFLLVTVPVVESSENLIRTTIHASIQNDTLKGDATRVVDGLPRCDVATRVNFLSDNKRSEYWKEYLQLGQNNCVIDNITINGLKGRDSMLTLGCTYKIPKYVIALDNELFVNLNLIKEWNNRDIDLKTRTRDYIFDKTETNEIITTFRVPDGYSVSSIPPDFSADKGLFSYSASYRQEGNTIVYTQKHSFNTLELDKKDFTAWNELIEQVYKSYRQTIVLKRK